MSLFPRVSNCLHVLPFMNDVKASSKLAGGKRRSSRIHLIWYQWIKGLDVASVACIG